MDLRLLIECENSFPITMADCEQRAWGRLFHNRDNPTSHDSNHALIERLDVDMPGVIQEITAFYGSRGLTPRVYQAFVPGEFEAVLPLLRQAGFTAGPNCEDELFYEWVGPCRLAPHPAVEVRQISAMDEALRAFLVAGSEESAPRVAKVLERQLGRADVQVFVAYVDGLPVSRAALETVAGASRVDDVMTPMPYRNHGYARAVIGELVRYQRKAIGAPLYLYASNPVAVRIYQEAGFRLLDVDLRFWSGWLEQAPTRPSPAS